MCCDHQSTGSTQGVTSSLQNIMEHNSRQHGDTLQQEVCLSETLVGRQLDNDYSNRDSTLPIFVAEMTQSHAVRAGEADDWHVSDDVSDSETRNKHFDVVTDQMNDINADEIYSQDNDGDTLLHTSIILKKTEESMMLISLAPTDKWLSLQNLLFQTPLHLAALSNQSEITRRLVVSGADVTSQDKDGNTALHISCRDGSMNVVKALLQPLDLQYSETQQANYEIPCQDIPQDFRIVNYDGLTCLHLAAINGHTNIINILIEYDVDLNMKEHKTGRTVLHDACVNGNTKLVKLLLHNKMCDINARAFDGSTPFDLARSRSFNDICIILAGAGARYGNDGVNTD